MDTVANKPTNQQMGSDPRRPYAFYMNEVCYESIRFSAYYALSYNISFFFGIAKDMSIVKNICSLHFFYLMLLSVL